MVGREPREIRDLEGRGLFLPPLAQDSSELSESIQAESGHYSRRLTQENKRQMVCQTRDGEMTQATERRKLLVCPLILQTQRQEVILYPMVTATAVKTSKKLVGTGSGNAQFVGPSLQRRDGEGQKWVCNQISP